MTLATIAAALASGALIGLVLGLVAATAMPIGVAVGTSLAVVAALGMTTAASYAWSAYVDWPLAALLIAGGVAGAMAGIRIGRHLAGRKGMLEKLFAAIVMGIGIYVATMAK